MTDVYHHYLGKGRKVPKPTAAQIDREASRAELVAAQARERIAKATLAEVDVQRRRRELIDRATAIQQASFLFISIRQRLLSLATSLPRKLAGKSPHEMKMILDRQIRECLTELSELPDRITREQWEDFVEAEKAENGEKQPAKRKTSR
jgi:hypothetical protein